jgi:Family of unknown function (DUF5908)
MSLLIRELHIKVTVNQPQGGAAPQPAPTEAKKDDDKEAVIAQCVDEVVNIINNKKER